MERFDFFFSLHLGERLYAHTDNLSKDLQGTKVTAVSGQRLANLTKETLTKISQTGGWRWCTKLLPIKLPSINLEGSVVRLLILSSVLSISALIRKASAPTLRWRPFWLKLLNGDDSEAEFKFLEASYSEDVDTGAQTRHATKYLEVMLKEKISCFDEILLAVSNFQEPEKKLIQEVQTICKLPAVNPATSAAGELSFSSQCTASEDVVFIRDG